MTVPTTTTGSKPAVLSALNAVWRSSAEHLAQQVARFLRLTALAALPSLLDLLKGGKFDYATLITFIVPFAEVGYRQMFPAMSAAAADSAPGVTIVPEQLGLTSAQLPSVTDPGSGPPDVTPTAPPAAPSAP